MTGCHILYHAKNLLRRLIPLLLVMLPGCVTNLITDAKYPNAIAFATADAISSAVWAEALGRPLTPVAIELLRPAEGRLCNLTDLEEHRVGRCYVAMLNTAKCAQDGDCLILQLDPQLWQTKKFRSVIKRAINNPCEYLPHSRKWGPPTPDNPDVYLPGLYYSLATSTSVLGCGQLKPVTLEMIAVENSLILHKQYTSGR